MSDKLSTYFNSKPCIEGRHGHTQDDLKNLCRTLGLRVSGTKAELCNRLKVYFHEEGKYNPPVPTRVSSLPDYIPKKPKIKRSEPFSEFFPKFIGIPTSIPSKQVSKNEQTPIAPPRRKVEHSGVVHQPPKIVERIPIAPSRIQKVGPNQGQVVRRRRVVIEEF